MNKKTAAATMVSAGIMLGILLSPVCALADVYVGTNFYIGAGIVIGGATIFFLFSFGEHNRYAQSRNLAPASAIPDSAPDSFLLTSSVQDLPVNDGMITIFTW